MMSLDERVKRLGTVNTGIGMKIIMKNNATERQIELAKKFYPDAIVIKEVKEEYIDYTGFVDIFALFNQSKEKQKINFSFVEEEEKYEEEKMVTEELEVPLYYEVAA